MSALRVHRAGESIEDYCRACKTDRTHTIIVVDGQGLPIRVTCDYCQSQHNYRGGPRLESLRDPGGKRGPGTQRAPVVSGIETATLDAPARPSRATTASEAFPLVSDRERVAPRMPTFEAPPTSNFCYAGSFAKRRASRRWRPRPSGAAARSFFGRALRVFRSAAGPSTRSSTRS